MNEYDAVAAAKIGRRGREGEKMQGYFNHKFLPYHIENPCSSLSQTNYSMIVTVLEFQIVQYFHCLAALSRQMWKVPLFLQLLSFIVKLICTHFLIVCFPSDSFIVMCYNVLCDKYCTKSMYGYCPSWALKWEYRKKLIMNEILQHQGDILSLQVNKFVLLRFVFALLTF